MHPRDPSSTALGPGHRWLADCLIVDPDAPSLAEFLRGEILRGAIRTAPAGRGRVVLVPADDRPRGRPAPRP